MTIQAVTTPSAVSIKATQYESAQQTAAQENAGGTAVTEQIKSIPKQDEFIKSDELKDVTYQKPQALSADDVQTLKEQQLESYRNMIKNMFENQAKGSVSSSFSVSINIEISIDGISESSDANAEDYWGVDAVASRIMDMAISLSGGDTSKLELLRGAVEDGFKQAGEAWGSDLPEISNRTYDEVMTRFDYWKENGSLDGYQYSGVISEEA